GRSRMRADTTLRAPKVPRGLLYSTGEEIPPGLSQVARAWLIEWPKDQITSERLTAAQEASGLYSRATAGDLPWLAPRMKGAAAAIRADVAALRPTYQATHRRTSDIAANLEIGWIRFLEFAVACDVVDDVEREQLLARIRAALLRGAVAQAQHQRELYP